jgi:hypothetical protein
MVFIVASFLRNQWVLSTSGSAPCQDRPGKPARGAGTRNAHPSPITSQSARHAPEFRTQSLETVSKISTGIFKLISNFSQNFRKKTPQISLPSPRSSPSLRMGLTPLSGSPKESLRITSALSLMRLLLAKWIVKIQRIFDAANIYSQQHRGMRNLGELRWNMVRQLEMMWKLLMNWRGK